MHGSPFNLPSESQLFPFELYSSVEQCLLLCEAFIRITPCSGHMSLKGHAKLGQESPAREARCNWAQPSWSLCGDRATWHGLTGTAERTAVPKAF